MGDHNVAADADARHKRAFTKALLDDVVALERMIDAGMIEGGVRRIGAEQEMFLVDPKMRPASVGPSVLERLRALPDDRFTDELAQFNLEANLAAREFAGHCLRDMEAEIEEVLERVRAAAAPDAADVLLTGILPTLHRQDLTLSNMTPEPRYYALNDVLARFRGGEFHILIQGLDQLELRHDSVMLEACNTSFQIHFQVSPDEFAHLYNLAQAVAAPVLAAAVNSPVLLRHRLWNETRIALFERSIDTRNTAQQTRSLVSRVHFGEAWVERSVLELFREDIARQRVVLAGVYDEDPLGKLDRGDVPELRALRMHNGTVYRWNRPCYGVVDGVPHLRIENRVLPAGPTPADEVANAAFFFGLMATLGDEYGPIKQAMRFADAKANLTAAAREGLNAHFTWVGGETHSAPALILEHLLPIARRGLLKRGLDGNDVTRYLDIIEQRVSTRHTGAQWTVRSLDRMSDSVTPEQQYRAVTAKMLENERGGQPVHTWDLATVDDHDWRPSYQTVGQFMTTDLFTVGPGDIADLAASVMDWRGIRHIPVEDEDGKLVGLVSHRALLRLVARGQDANASAERPTVESIMVPDPITVGPDTSTLDVIRLMRDREIGCLPVVEGDRLVGIVTDRDLIRVSARLLEQFLSQDADG